MTEGADLVEAVAVTRFPVDSDEVTSFLVAWINVTTFKFLVLGSFGSNGEE